MIKLVESLYSKGSRNIVNAIASLYIFVVVLSVLVGRLCHIPSLDPEAISFLKSNVSSIGIVANFLNWIGLQDASSWLIAHQLVIPSEYPYFGDVFIRWTILFVVVLYIFLFALIYEVRDYQNSFNKDIVNQSDLAFTFACALFIDIWPINAAVLGSYLPFLRHWRGWGFLAVLILIFLLNGFVSCQNKDAGIERRRMRFLVRCKYYISFLFSKRKLKKFVWSGFKAAFYLFIKMILCMMYWLIAPVLLFCGANLAQDLDFGLANDKEKDFN